ncbi:MAG: FAD-dependent oxidoreductase [Candidatus Diapherotrites archaeon]|nr:FAD-dependent oxidoreductase [Candidatus Diapherotrites archaeon]
MTEIWDCIILGGSGAGAAAAIYAARAGLKTLVVTKDFGGQLLNTEFVENYPGIKHIGGLEIGKALEEHVRAYEKEGLKVVLDPIVRVEKKDKLFEVETDMEGTYFGKTVILGTGMNPKKLNVPGSKEFDSKGVHYCATCDGPIYKGKEMIVVGGGYSGIEHALYLSGIASKVYVIEFNSVLGGEEITQKQLLKQKNVEILLNTEVQEIFGTKFAEGIKVKDRKTGQVKEIKAPGIFIAIGQVPNTKFLKFSLSENKGGEIIIDEKNRTNIEGLFAAGDVTTYPIKQLVTSAGEGCKAALYCNDYLKGKIKWND